MSEEFFDQFEKLTPTGKQDISPNDLLKLLTKIPEPSEETKIAIKIVDSFKSASKIKLPVDDGTYLWLGYCVGGYHESPRREEYFIFAMKIHGESKLGYATSIDNNAGDRGTKFISKSDIENIKDVQIDELIKILHSKPPPNTGKHRQDWFSPIIYTEGSSINFSPLVSAKYYLRQDSDKLLFVQPSICGGWYGELWPVVVL